MKYVFYAFFLGSVSGLVFANQVVQKEPSGGPINFEGNVINSPCIIQGGTKSQTVLLGDVSVKELVKNTKGDSKIFIITLTDCDLSGTDSSGGAANYTKAKIMFSGSKANEVGDILRLIAVDGAAQDVGVQITEKGGTKGLVLDTEYTAPKTLTTGVSSYDFPFTAYYIKNGNPVAGKANATVNFTVVYE